MLCVGRLSHQWSITSNGDGALGISSVLLGLGAVESVDEGNLGIVRAGVMIDNSIRIYTSIELYTINLVFMSNGCCYHIGAESYVGLPHY